MSIVIAGVLIVVGLVSAVIVAVGVPLFFGVMAYDVITSPRRKAAEAGISDAATKIALERGVARAFVLAGGAFWSVAGFAAFYSFRQTGVAYALLAALYPLVACLVTLIVGWYYERFTAVLLLVASIAVVVWGVIFQFEMGVWILMTLALIAPMLTASVLFWMARRDQDAFERATSLRPELALVFAARSTIV